MSALEPSFDATLDARLEDLERVASGLISRPDQTLRPKAAHEADAGRRALEMLRGLDTTTGRIAVQGTLGEGGMGIVRAGRQLALGRDVAVKTVKPEARTESATLKLLREAWVTGTLEHPNVVPVHDVSLDADGHPQIILKKIAGDEWSVLLRDPARVRARFSVRDPFEWNVRVLMQVCNAIDYAHARGIVHRDLKPENVMVGEFGEVYVLDWGIAVALLDDRSGRIPLASEAIGVAGTPAYMAPEMLEGRADALSRQTDVYLLGAMLYELLAGHAPHTGDTWMEIFHRIACVEPALPEGTPAELARIVRCAMARTPAERFESAEALRIALSTFLEHRGSLELAERAEGRLLELQAERTQPGDDAEGWRLRLYHLFGECRFGFLEALRRWRDNERARLGLRAALVVMIEFELESDDPRAAALLLGELDDPPDDLVTRVAKARVAHEAEEARRVALARDLDPDVGRRTRRFLTLLLGSMWSLSPLLTWLLDPRRATQTHRHFLLLSVTMTLLAGALGLWARDSLSKTVINRNLAGAVGVALLSQIALTSACWVLGVSFEATLLLAMFDHALVATMVAVGTVPRMWPAAVAFWAALAIACAEQTWTLPSIAAANVVMTVNGLLLWGRVDEDDFSLIRARQARGRKEFRAFLERQRFRRNSTPEPPAPR